MGAPAFFGPAILDLPAWSCIVRLVTAVQHAQVSAVSHGFVADPVLVPGVVALVAVRSEAGLALPWAAGDAADPVKLEVLAGFLGAEFRKVDDVLYRRSSSGDLDRIDLSRAGVFVRPNATSVVDGFVFVEVAEFVRRYAVVAAEVSTEVEAAVAPVYDDLTVAELRDALQLRGLSSSGNKAELVARLVEDDEQKAV